jgi:hypothetical protein
VEVDDLAKGCFSLQADTVPVLVAGGMSFSTEIVKVISTVVASAEERKNKTVPSSVSADLDSVNWNKNSD